MRLYYVQYTECRRTKISHLCSVCVKRKRWLRMAREREWGDIQCTEYVDKASCVRYDAAVR
jgi:hypothetical protein